MRFLFLFLAISVSAADWPTYRADAARSGVTQEQIKLPLQPAWTHQPVHAPRPAWRGPAKRDMYNDKHNDLKNRQLFDHAFHVVADAKSIYFGSSADDQVHCLDSVTGTERWSYFTEGPVRLAPTLHDGKLYFGSDDGHAYCITTEGKLIWRQRLAPRDYRIAGNNRIISAWPVRTGVIVSDGMAYAGAGMFPSEGVHVVALKSADGIEQWRKTQGKMPAQGYMLMSKTVLYVPAGRNNPVLYRRSDGQQLSAAMGGGGTEATVDNGLLFSGPGRKGSMVLVKSHEKGVDSDIIATFPGNQFVVGEKRSFLLGDNILSAMDRVLFNQCANEVAKLNIEKRKLGKQLKEAREKKSPDAKKVQARLIEVSRRKDVVARGLNLDPTQVAAEARGLAAKLPGIKSAANKAGLNLQREIDAAGQSLDKAVVLGVPSNALRMIGPLESAAKALKAAKALVDVAVKPVEAVNKQVSEALAEAEELRQMARVACVLWRTECDQPHALILTGNAVFAGGTDEVVAYAVADGKKSWAAKVNGVALGLAVAHGRLMVSTHRGTIHCFSAK